MRDTLKHKAEEDRSHFSRGDIFLGSLMCVCSLGCIVDRNASISCFLEMKKALQLRLNFARYTLITLRNSRSRRVMVLETEIDKVFDSDGAHESFSVLANQRCEAVEILECDGVGVEEGL